MAFDGLSVCEEQLASALLAVLAKLSLVPAPVVLHFIEVFEIEGLLKLVRMLVVKNALAVEFLIDPHAIVSWFVLGVVKNASAINLIVFELAFVEGSVGKEQLPPAILLAIQVLSLVVSSFLVFSLEILYLFQAVPHLPHLHLVLLLDEALLAAL